MKYALLLLSIALQVESTVFYLVRHGQTDWNIEKRLQGQSDIPLNDTGRSQAAQLSAKLGEIAFEAVFSSDLQRASETAQILSGIPVGMEPRLRERSFGSWEGCLESKFEEFLDRDPQLLGIETDESIQKRVFPCLQEIAKRYPDSTVLVVTHGGVIRSLVAELYPYKCTSLYDIQVKNMGILQLAISEGECRIREMDGIQIP